MPESLFNSDCLTPYSSEFENIYLQVRKAEQRIYTDIEVERLPLVAKEHIHFKEWQIRKASSDKLIKYLRSRNQSLKILEIGCGNGWFSAALAKADSSWTVTGTDINNTELEQAKRVFDSIPNLRFSFFDINTNEVIAEGYDIILFAASIQYFPSLKNTIEKTLALLNSKGEIHLVDTIFYKKEMLMAARERTVEYFRKLGFSEAAKNYFHHSLDDLDGFEFAILQRPAARLQKLFGKRPPFYWICIKKDRS